jgi:hypothetical protein
MYDLVIVLLCSSDIHSVTVYSRHVVHQYVHTLQQVTLLCNVTLRNMLQALMLHIMYAAVLFLMCLMCLMYIAAGLSHH